MFCLSVSSVGLTKILNMSHDVGRQSNASFISRSKRQNSSVSICWPMNSRGVQYNGTTKDVHGLLINSFMPINCFLSVFI